MTASLTRHVLKSSVRRLAFAAVCAVYLFAPSSFAQQSTSDTGSSQSVPQNKQQTPPPAHKSAAQENPFPTDVSKQAEQQQQGGSSASTPPSPDAPDAGQTPPATEKKPGNAAQDNPFPEDVSKGAADAAAKAADSSSSSGASPYSSSSSSNPDGANSGGDPNGDIPPETGRRKLRKPSDKDIQSGSLTAQGKAQDDAKVGRFYLDTGDYKGAYARFAEATRFDPTNVDAIYGIAAAAQGLHHADEALTNYKLYLAISPDGDHAKAAEKAIRALTK